MQSRLSTWSQRLKWRCNALGALPYGVQQKHTMTVSKFNPVHAPRAGKVGGPLVLGETTAEKLERAKGQNWVSLKVQ
jgi:hypothetical protein